MTITAGLLADQQHQDHFTVMESCLKDAVGGDLLKTSDLRELLDWVREAKVSVAIIDESIEGEMVDRAFLENIIRQNAMMDIVIAGSVDEKKFHHKTEGLGILMQLPAEPGEPETMQMIERLQKISGLLGGIEENQS